MHRSIVPTFLRIVLNRNPAQKQKYQKGMNEQVSQITARQLKADYLCKLTMPSVPTHLTPDKIPKTSPHPSEQILLILLRMFTLKSRVTAKFEDDEEGIKLHVWLERASVKGCLVLRKKFQVDIAWSNFKTWQHCHTNYLHRWLKWHFSITAKNLTCW